jgi:sugar lactone lactonase YvrE
VPESDFNALRRLPWRIPSSAAADANEGGVVGIMPIHVEVYAGIRGEEGHRDGPRFDAKFEFPETILQRPGGELVVAERGGPWLRLIDREGMVRTQQLVGRLNETDVPLEPYGRIFITPRSELYVSEKGRMWRAEWNALAERLLCVAGPKIAFTRFVVRDGVMLGATAATPTTGAQLIEVTWDGTVNVVAKLRGGGAGGMAIGADGLLYVNERERILRVSRTGLLEELRPTNTPPPQLGDLWFSDSMAGMATDGDGNLYVTDTYGDVLSMSPDGHVEIAVAAPDGPMDVLVSNDGYVYVADYHNHVILRSLDQVAPPV